VEFTCENVNVCKENQTKTQKSDPCPLLTLAKARLFEDNYSFVISNEVRNLSTGKFERFLVSLGMTRAPTDD
jgi:hypothetical protein